MEPAVSSKRSPSEIGEITLSELMHRVGATLRREFTQGYWFSCDIDSINHHVSGNVYLTLGHVNEGGQRASAKAIIWKNYSSLIQKFESQTGIRFAKHISVLFLGQVTFNSEYGLSIKIVDLNPSFSIGQHELKLRMIRQELEARGYAQQNRSLMKPREFTRVAVIAPHNAAGLHDFKTKAEHLQNHGLCQFDYFYAMFQGERRIETIQAAFTELVRNDIDYDCVCLIRGGGDAASLSELAEWKIAVMVCRCPYPVFSGIGHESDEILIDDYANIGFATPSMVVSHLFDTIVSNAQYARSCFDNLTRTAQLIAASNRQECETYHHTVFHQMWFAMNTWRTEIARQRDMIFHTSKQTVVGSRFSLRNDFHGLMSSSHLGVHKQKSVSMANYDSMKMNAFKAVQQSKGEMIQLKVELERQSRISIDKAKQEVVRQFNNVQLSSTRVISEQRRLLTETWLKLNSEAKSEVNVAKQGLAHKRMISLSQARRHVSSCQLEVNANWNEVKKLGNNRVDREKERVLTEYRVIDAYAPQRTLERGYSIIYGCDGRVIKDVGAVCSGEQIKIRLKDGCLVARVDKEGIDNHD